MTLQAQRVLVARLRVHQTALLMESERLLVNRPGRLGEVSAHYYQDPKAVGTPSGTHQPGAPEGYQGIVAEMFRRRLRRQP